MYNDKYKSSLGADNSSPQSQNQNNKLQMVFHHERFFFCGGRLTITISWHSSRKLTVFLGFAGRIWPSTPFMRACRPPVGVPAGCLGVDTPLLHPSDADNREYAA